MFFLQVCFWNKGWIFFFLFYSCLSYILFVSTSNSFCNKGFQNLLSFLWGNNKGWNKQRRWLYITLSFQILAPSCYELHGRASLYCASDTDKMKEALTSYKEQVHLWCKCWRSVKNDLIFEENIMCSEVFKFEILQMFSSQEYQFHK